MQEYNVQDMLRQLRETMQKSQARQLRLAEARKREKKGDVIPFPVNRLVRKPLVSWER